MNFNLNINPVPSSPYQFLVHEGMSDVQWHLGGAFLYDQFLHMYAKNLKNILRDATSLASVGGAPANIWSLDWYDQYSLMPPLEVERSMEAYSSSSIPLILSFNNPFVSLAECEDPLGNILLQSLQFFNSYGKNAVAIASPVLAAYIAEKYPTLKRISHVNRIVYEKSQGNWRHYRTLSKEFERVCIHPDDLLDPERLAKELPNRESYDLTVNDICFVRCPLRFAHMKALHSISREPMNVQRLSQRFDILTKAGCQNMLDVRLKPVLRMSHERLEAYYDLGFRHFRIQTESLRSELSFLYDVVHYMLTNKPEDIPRRQVFVSSLLLEMTQESTKASSGLNEFKMRHFL